MNKSRYFILVAILSGVIILITACNAFAPAPTPTLPPTATVEKIVDSPTPAPTDTPYVTDTPTPTETAVPTATIAPSSTPVMDFSKVKIINLGFLPNWRCLFTLELPKPVEGQYYLMVQTNKQYKCEVIAKFPNRLYCTGPLAVIDDYVDVSLFMVGASEPVLYAKPFIPYPPWAVPQ